MKLLFKAAIRTKKHLVLSIITTVMLLFLTVANQMEMFSMGFIANNGADFFMLFGKDKKGRMHSRDAVKLQDIQQRWDKIDTNNTGVITKKDAAIYIASRKNTNPLNRVYRTVATKFNIDNNFSALIYILIFVAIFKAIFLFAS